MATRIWAQSRSFYITANPYFLAAEQRPSIFFTDDTRIRCAPSAARQLKQSLVVITA